MYLKLPDAPQQIPGWWAFFLSRAFCLSRVTIIFPIFVPYLRSWYSQNKPVPSMLVFDPGLFTLPFFREKLRVEGGQRDILKACPALTQRLRKRQRIIQSHRGPSAQPGPRPRGLESKALSANVRQSPISRAFGEAPGRVEKLWL